VRKVILERTGGTGDQKKLVQLLQSITMLQMRVTVVQVCTV